MTASTDVFVAVLAGINWPAVVFVAFAAVMWLYLLRANNDSSTFKIVDLITDSRGRGFSPSFAYTGTFLLAVWVVFTLMVAKEWGIALGGLGTMLGTYAVVSAVGRATQAKERTDAIRAINKVPEPPQPIKTTLTATSETEPAT